MAIFRNLFRWVTSVAATGQNKGTQDTRPPPRSGSGPDTGIDGALQVSAVWACVELLADNIASLPIFVYTKPNSTTGHKDLDRESPLWFLLHENPNRHMTPLEFWCYMAMQFFLRGNAYAWLVRNEAGEVIEMWPLAADQVVVKVMPDRSIVFEYYYDGKIIIYSEQSIFHWKDKGNGIVGASRLDYMRQTVNLALGAQSHASGTFNRSGKRPGVFMIDKLLTKEQRAQVRANYSELTEGDNTDLLVLELGAKFEPLSLTPADLQLLETRRFTVEEVGRWFGIPSVLINDTSKSTTWGTGISQIIEGFYKLRFRPVVVSLEQAIRKRILTPEQRRRNTVEISIDALLRSDYKGRLEAGVAAVNNGLITRNEWRQLENYPRVDGADSLTAQGALLPLDQLGKRPQTAGVPNVA